MLQSLLICTLAFAADDPTKGLRVSSPDKKSDYFSDGKMVERSDTATQKLEWRYQGLSGTVTALAIGQDGKFLGIGSDDGQVSVLDSATGKQLLQLKCGAAVEKLEFSADGRLATAKLAKGKEIKFELATGKVVGQ